MIGLCGEVGTVTSRFQGFLELRLFVVELGVDGQVIQGKVACRRLLGTVINVNSNCNAQTQPNGGNECPLAPVRRADRPVGRFLEEWISGALRNNECGRGLVALEPAEERGRRRLVEHVWILSKEVLGRRERQSVASPRNWRFIGTTLPTNCNASTPYGALGVNSDERRGFAHQVTDAEYTE